MQTREDFIAREIIPTLGEFADGYDVGAIADEVSEYDPPEGYVWKSEYADADESDRYWDVVARHARTSMEQIGSVTDDGWAFPVYSYGDDTYSIDLGGATGLTDPCAFDTQEDAFAAFERAVMGEEDE